MPKSTRNSGKQWSASEVKQLRSLAKRNTPTGVIGLRLGRSKAAVQSKAGEKRVSLEPVNRSPYNRRKS